MLSTVKRLGTSTEAGVVRDLTEDRAFADVSLKQVVPGYGSVPMSAMVPASDLTAILEGEREIETTLKIRVSGYGSRSVDVRVLPVEQGDAAESARTVKTRVPGYGYAPTRMHFARA